ncbi:hypothetical protein PILCRDRAFT_610410 [Piloderma croceum F 1598]|uniref:Uncharacterized protein n=1 Tax=Piloderma croceum (strain F 1598) TaxID=765440 RepID=A0A0C3EZ51_PILCF|nr:hypothetical protein PILCRDRAFT_610410 [Piloderma croceum F 1598]
MVLCIFVPAAAELLGKFRERHVITDVVGKARNDHTRLQVIRLRPCRDVVGRCYPFHSTLESAEFFLKLPWLDYEALDR